MRPTTILSCSAAVALVVLLADQLRAGPTQSESQVREDGNTVDLFIDAGAATKVGITHVVNQVGFSFAPVNITVLPGDTVEWHWSSGFHTVTSGLPCTSDGLFHELLDPANTLATFVIPDDGTTLIPYLCVPHCGIGMTGTITILVPNCAGVNNCSGNGTCVGADICECDPGWVGVDCSIPTCAGVNDCSGNGTCFAPDTCQCDSGWEGADCSTFNCIGVNNCSTHGTCIGANTCQCDAGWTGIDCSTPTCAGVNDCSGNGTCIAPDTCQCGAGWSGADCSTFTCDDLAGCSGNGTCTGPNNCECDAGFAGRDCSCSPGTTCPPFPALGIHATPKHRYLSINTSANGLTMTALRIDLVSMRRCNLDSERACVEDNDCNSGATGPCLQHPDVGSTWWVQAPQEEPLGCLPGPCGPTDQFARVDASPHFQVWDLSTLHIGDCEMVPVATYEVRACLPPDGTICSDPLTIGTIEQPFIAPGFRGNYGDVVGAVLEDPPSFFYFTPPDGFTNVVDIVGYTKTKQNYGTANTPQTHPTWVDLHGPGDGNPPQYILNVADLGQIKKAFGGDAWTDDPGNMNPGECP